MELGVVLY